MSSPGSQQAVTQYLPLSWDASQGRFREDFQDRLLIDADKEERIKDRLLTNADEGE